MLSPLVDANPALIKLVCSCWVGCVTLCTLHGPLATSSTCQSIMCSVHISRTAASQSCCAVRLAVSSDAMRQLLCAWAGYGMLGPFAKHKGWAPGPIGDWKSGATGWVLWISLAIMLGDSLTSLSLLLITSLRRNIAAIRRVTAACEPLSAL